MNLQQAINRCKLSDALLATLSRPKQTTVVE